MRKAKEKGRENARSRGTYLARGRERATGK